MTGKLNVLQSVRTTRRDLAEARDAQLLQVVSMIDRLEERGDADGILSPLRTRLRSLRPARPLRFARLLFTPVDHLIVDASVWRPGEPFVSRASILPIVLLVRSKTPVDLIADVDRLIAVANGNVAPDALKGTVMNAGLLLWPLAASVLRAASFGPPTAAWKSAAMPVADFGPFLSAFAFALSQEAHIENLERQVWTPELDRALSNVLREAVGHGPCAWGMAAALLMQRFPGCTAPFKSALAVPATAAGFGDAGRAAFAAALSGLEKSNLASGEIGAAARARIARLSTLADALAASFPEAQGRGRAQQQKARLQVSCVATFQAALKGGLSEVLQPECGTISDDVLEGSEQTARQLRQFEQTARKLGGGALYDSMLADTACNVQRLASLDAVEKGRLVEILQGPSTAWSNLRLMLPT